MPPNAQLGGGGGGRPPPVEPPCHLKVDRYDNLVLEEASILV